MRNIASKNNGTALIITMVYLIIVSIVCAVVLTFSSGHYKLITDRVNRFQSIYYSEGGLYLGIYGSTGMFYIENGNSSSWSEVTQPVGDVNSSNLYQPL